MTSEEVSRGKREEEFGMGRGKGRREAVYMGTVNLIAKGIRCVFGQCEALDWVVQW